eukprot:1583584-Amphidinium_carterae.1
MVTTAPPPPPPPAAAPVQPPPPIPSRPMVTTAPPPPQPRPPATASVQPPLPIPTGNARLEDAKAGLASDSSHVPAVSSESDGKVMEDPQPRTNEGSRSHSSAFEASRPRVVIDGANVMARFSKTLGDVNRFSVEGLELTIEDLKAKGYDPEAVVKQSFMDSPNILSEQDKGILR